MTTTATPRDTDGPRTYGGYRPPASPGLFGFGTAGTALLVAATFAVFAVWQTIGLLAALITAVVSGLLLFLVRATDRDRRNLLTRGTAAIAGHLNRRRGLADYRSGPLSAHEWGTHALPGLLAATELWEAADSYERPTAVLRWTGNGDTTLILKAAPDGLSLVDTEQVDLWVAGYGAALASLAEEPGLVGCTFMIESFPDTGAGLAAVVAARTDLRGHAISRAVLAESADTFATGTPRVTAWVTLTYETGGAKTGLTEEVQALVDRVAGLAATVSDAGLGEARPASAREVCEDVLIAYDPAKQTDVDAVHAQHRELDYPLSWDDVGPASAADLRGYYRHDSGVSRTWEMVTPPRGVHYSNILTGLLSPAPGIRKRVALLHQVIPPWRAAKMVESDLRTAEFRVGQSNKPTARALTERDAARQTAQEEAEGAALVNTCLVLTATVTDTTDRDGQPLPAVQQLPAVNTAVGNASASARIRLRIKTDEQAAGFTVTLPVGVVPARHSRTPATEGAL